MPLLQPCMAGLSASDMTDASERGPSGAYANSLTLYFLTWTLYLRVRPPRVCPFRFVTCVGTWGFVCVCVPRSLTFPIAILRLAACT